MNKTIILLLFCFIPVLVFTQNPIYPNDPHWQLKWEDNFNTFDTTHKWMRAHYCDHAGEPQLFLKQNVWVANGNLVIEINNNKAYCPSNPPPVTTYACGSCVEGWHNFTSGWVDTRSTFYTKFGYIEARIKLPYRPGFFHHAFWTWKGSGEHMDEIDIFEMGWQPKSNEVTTNIHTCYYDSITNPDCLENYFQEHSFSGFNYSDWHIYAIEWDVNKITWYIDNIPFRTSINPGIIDPVRLILGMGIKNAPTSPPFQEHMYVDYVKVYQLNCDKNTVVTQIPNFNTYNYAVKKSISLDGQTQIPNNSNITLRANDFIELKPGFEVQTGRELYLDVSPCEIPNSVKPPDLRDNN